jgi:hypothetical protein
MYTETTIDGQDAGVGDECHHCVTVIMIAVTSWVHCYISI